MIVLGLPREWQFGVDLTIWGVSERFTGITDIPPGVHYVYHSPPNEIWRIGELLQLENNICIYKYDSGEEKLIRRKKMESEQSVIASLIDDMRIGSGLVSFSRVVDRTEKWKKLSNLISAADMQLVQIPQLVIPSGTIGSDLTRLATDKTEYLKQIISSRGYDGDEKLVGEIQLGYIEFLLGQNYDGMIHWRNLLEIFLNCSSTGIDANEHLFGQLIETLIVQLEEIPSDILADVGEDGKIFLVPLIARFLEECSVLEGNMKKLCDELSAVMTKKLGGDNEWEIDNDLDDPVVV